MLLRSNFELGDMNFFRSEAYRSYFDYLDRYSFLNHSLIPASITLFDTPLCI